MLFLAAFSMLALAAMWPRHGLYQRWLRLRSLTRRRQQEDALKHILKQEARGQAPTIESVAGAVQISPNRAAKLLEELETQGLATYAAGKLTLESRGRDLGLHVVRAHRLWESYLAENTGLAEESWHGEAELREHELSPAQAQALAASLGNPTHDPHGDAIPEAGGALAEERGQPVNLASTDSIALIVHVEDEPDSIYRQIIALGFRPGMLVRVLEKSHQSIRIWAEGSVHILPLIVANNISVVPVADPQPCNLPGERHLADLRRGAVGHIAGLSPAFRGQERRRLLDLGFVPGTPVEVEMSGPAGDPTAYRLRGTLVALRKEQAAQIRITESPTAHA
jgi:DtxR family Mn-dependent transcriptional regulator